MSRRPRSCRALKSRARSACRITAGVLDVVQKGVDLADAMTIVQIESSRLEVLPTARASESADLVASVAMQGFLQDLTGYGQSRFLVIDLPPVLTSHDVISILPQVDCVLFVVGVGVSQSVGHRGMRQVSRHDERGQGCAEQGIRVRHNTRLQLRRPPSLNTARYDNPAGRSRPRPDTVARCETVASCQELADTPQPAAGDIVSHASPRRLRRRSDTVVAPITAKLLVALAKGHIGLHVGIAILPCDRHVAPDVVPESWRRTAMSCPAARHRGTGCGCMPDRPLRNHRGCNLIARCPSCVDVMVVEAPSGHLHGTSRPAGSEPDCSPMIPRHC